MVIFCLVELTLFEISIESSVLMFDVISDVFIFFS